MVYKWLYKEPSTISKHHRDWILGPTQHHDIFPSTSHGYRGLILCRIRAPLQVIQVFGFLTKHRVGIRSSSQGWLKMRNVVIIQLIQLVQLMCIYIFVICQWYRMLEVYILRSSNHVKSIQIPWKSHYCHIDVQVQFIFMGFTENIAPHSIHSPLIMFYLFPY